MSGGMPQPTPEITYVSVGSPLLLSAAAAPTDSVNITLYAPTAGGAGASDELVAVGSVSAMSFLRLPLGFGVSFQGFSLPLLLKCSAE